MATVGFLIFGLRAMMTNNQRQSQLMMRGRVLAQGFTIAVIAGGLFYRSVYKNPKTE